MSKPCRVPISSYSLKKENNISVSNPKSFKASSKSSSNADNDSDVDIGSDFEFDDDDNEPVVKPKPSKKPVAKPSEKPAVKPSDISKECPPEDFIRAANKSKFRLQSKTVFFTYKHHIPFEDLFKHVNSIKPIGEYVICHELGDKSHNYKHTHMTVMFQKKIDVSNAQLFDIVFNGKTVHPNIGSTRNWVASCAYCLKEHKKDPQLDVNWFANFDVVDFLAKSRNPIAKKKSKDIGIVDVCNRVATHKNAFEAIKYEAGSLKQVLAINTIFNAIVPQIDPRQITYLESFATTIRDWQQNIIDVVSNESNRRKVYWVFDQRGGQGKTDLCSYLDTLLFPDTCITIAATGSLRDINDVMRNWINANKYPDIVLIDLPRTFEERDSIYTIVESMKNGRLTCTKYKGDTIKFFPPHVIIFANWLPDCNKLSRDRWVIMKLVTRKTNDESAFFQFLDPANLQKIIKIDLKELVGHSLSDANSIKKPSDIVPVDVPDETDIDFCDNIIDDSDNDSLMSSNGFFFSDDEVSDDSLMSSDDFFFGNDL